MRFLFLFALTIFSVAATQSASATTAKGRVLCKVDGVILDAASEEGHFDCMQDVLFGGACFTGSRQAVIDLINSREEFGSDEEWIEGAHFHGKNAISYIFRDGPNEQSEKVVMNRCTAEFFKN